MRNRTPVILLTWFILCQSCGSDQTHRWKSGDGHRWAKLSVPWSGRTGFKQVPASETGITFSNGLTEDQISDNRVLLNGSGVAIGDVDNDGFADVYFCRLDGPNRLYKNLGDWQFEDITDSAGVACAEQFSSGAVLADIDGDYDLDLLVTAVGGPNACFLNNGAGRFTAAPEAAGISSDRGASSMALADIDGDRDLDLYVTTYKKKRAKDIWGLGALSPQFIVDSTANSYGIAPEYQDHFDLDIRDQAVFVVETGEPDLLYLNDGHGHFMEVTTSDARFFDENGQPMSDHKDLGWVARFQDMDGDGDPDIYVCNDIGNPDRIWLNDGAGRFRAVSKYTIRNTSNSSLAVDFSDIDRDGDQDVFVADILGQRHWRRMRQKSTESPLPDGIGVIDNRPQYMRNTLLMNRGDQTYAEIAQFGGLQASGWSRSILFLDADLDGYEDLLVATGHYYDPRDYDAVVKMDERQSMDAMILEFSRTEEGKAIGVTMPGEKGMVGSIAFFPKLELPNMAFRNRGDLTFGEVSRDWGFNSVDISQAMALGDLDNDGDLDIVVNRLESEAAIYRNESNARRIAIRLRGFPPNTLGVGAKIRVLGGPVPQSDEVTNGGAYLSSSDPLYVFSVGKAKALTIEVRWRENLVTTITDAKPNRIYEIDQSGAIADSTAAARIDSQSFFEDVSHLIDHQHHEDPFEDFRRQPMLPERLSRLGPGLAWHDLDADGDDDLLITSGRGGQLALLRNEGSAGFQKIHAPLLTRNTESDQSAVLGWTRADGSSSILVGESNFEAAEPSNSSVLRHDFEHGNGTVNSNIQGDESSIGPMAMADYDGDGDLDLMIAGRSRPGRYPEPASARLYRNLNGTFEFDSTSSEALRQIGLISGAVFSDLDADTDPDLVFAVEWGPVMVFLNEGGSFENATQQLRLDAYHGRWHGVTTGDLDGDGKLDIIATNWGMNSKFENRYDDEHPLQLFYADFDKNGYLDVIEAYFDKGRNALLPFRNLHGMLQGLPNLRMRMPNHGKYSRSTLPEIIGPQLAQSDRLKANTLSHMVFFNRGERFEATPLPREAQFAPGFHVGVADFDGDGNEDVFLSQNFFALPAENSRADAGRGLWLKGDGVGGLEAISGQQSGVEVYGEQRGAAFSDYDHDGRIDLVVSQNAAATKLFHNVGAKPGLRIRLSGPPGNPAGIGATIRLVYSDGNGPAREVKAGSGYWSQDSVVQVMGLRGDVEAIWVRWPGGKITKQKTQPGKPEIVVRFDSPNP